MSQSLNETTGVQNRTAHLSENERYRLLSAERRRVLLDALADGTAPLGLRDLATAVAEREPGADASEEADVESVAVSLHHVHLPKMAELGVLSYDPDLHFVE